MKENTTTRHDGGLTELDRYLRALSDRDRRYLLYYLDEHGSGEIEEIARYIVARESNRSLSSISEEDSKRMQAKLHHEHLPRLRDYGVIDFDERQGDIRLAATAQLFTMLLGVCNLVEK